MIGENLTWKLAYTVTVQPLARDVDTTDQYTEQNYSDRQAHLIGHRTEDNSINGVVGRI